MKYTAVLSIFLFILLAFVTNGAAQSPGKILSQANRALGGEKVLRNLKSFQKTGTITRLKDSASGKFATRGAAPNFYNVEYDLDGFETETGYNGKSGWRRDSRDGLRTLTGDASRDFQAETNYRNNLWLDYKKEKSKITAGGQTVINGKPANSLLLTMAKGVQIKLYFDAATNLPVREEIPAGDVTKTFNYSDYRKIDGISEPFSINEKIGDDVYEIKLDEVKHNLQIAASNFDFPAISGAPLPDISTLLREVQANADKIDAILENYSYTQKITSRVLGKDGILRETESEIYQLSFYKGNRIRRLVEKNGKPLSVNDQKDEDKNVQKRVAEIEKDIAKREAKDANSADETPDSENRRISTAEVLRASKLTNPRRERFRGRDVIVFDFEPNPNFDLKNARSLLKFFGKVGGVVWIDEKDKQIARVDAALFDNFKIGGGLLANLKKGATFTLEQERVNDEIWLPSSADINLSVKVLLVKGIDINQIVKSYNYRKFNSEVKDSKVDEIKQP